MADVIVNHVSGRSPQFLDWLGARRRTAYAGMFLTFGGVFPGRRDGGGAAADLPPAAGPAVHAGDHADGTRRLVWTTFTSQQIDIDVAHPRGRAYLREVLERSRPAGCAGPAGRRGLRGEDPRHAAAS